jgi:hypothetical protein
MIGMGQKRTDFLKSGDNMGIKQNKITKDLTLF